MDEILNQLGGLLLGSVPTIILLTVLYFCYKVLVHKPLVKVLAERHNRTAGAIEKAKADVAAAEARTAEYEQRMREARMAVLKAQENRRQEAQQKRTAAVAVARSRAQEQIKQAKVGIENDKAAAQANLQAEAQELAIEIIHTVLRPVSPASSAAGGQ